MSWEVDLSKLGSSVEVNLAVQMPIVEDIPITTEVVLQKPAVTKTAITKAAINSVLLLPAIPELVQSFV